MDIEARRQSPLSGEIVRQEDWKGLVTPRERRLHVGEDIIRRRLVQWNVPNGHLNYASVIGCLDRFFEGEGVVIISLLSGDG